MLISHSTREITILTLQGLCIHLFCIHLLFLEITCPIQSVTYADPTTGTCVGADGKTSANYAYRTLCTFKCLQGYDRIGSETNTCQLDKTWSPSAPTCKGMQFITEGGHYLSGAPNDDFPLNTLKTLFRPSRVFFRSLEIHSKRRYGICIYLVILGTLDAIYRFPNVEIFSDSFLDHFF